MLLLNIAKSNLVILENTHSKPQETLEFKMKKQDESFSFDIPLELPEKWMMGVTSLEVYNTVYNITEKNNKFLIELDPELMSKISEIKLKPIFLFIEKQSQSPIPKDQFIKQLLEKTKHIKFCNKDYQDFESALLTLKLTQNEIDSLDMKFHSSDNNKDYCLIDFPPGVYELKDINKTLGGILYNVNKNYKKILPSTSEIQINIEADTISMNSILKTSHTVVFNSELNKVFGFTKTEYPKGTHKSEKPVMITPIDKVHLKCDCVDGSIVNGKRESILFSFNLSSPPGYKIIKEPTTILYKKINQTRLDHIRFYLEDSNHNPVDFNNESLTFTIQIIKI